MKSNQNLGAIILAAGKGKRMKTKNINKTSILLHGKPLIYYPVELLGKMRVDPILLVVGHARESVQRCLQNFKVTYAEQSKRLGTGHALKCAIPLIPDSITDIIVLYGDDAFIYTREIISNIINIHNMKMPSLTFMTINVNNPTGLGRIVRNNRDELVEIIEEKDATPEQRKIKEINPNLYIFKTGFLKKYIPKIPKSPVTGEYYLPSLIKLALDNNEKIEVFQGGFTPWQGVNTPSELAEARNILSSATRC